MVPKHCKAPRYQLCSWPWPLTSEQPGTVPEEHELARRRLAAIRIPRDGNTSASGPGTAGAPWDEPCPLGQTAGPSLLAFSTGTESRQWSTGLSRPLCPSWHPLLQSFHVWGPHWSPFTCPSLSPAPPHDSLALRAGDRLVPARPQGLQPLLPSPAQHSQAPGTFPLRPAPGWVGCLDGRRDALGRQKSLLWEAHQEGHAVQGRGGRGGQGGVTWCPHPGCLRRPSSLPPPSSGRPC